MIIRFIINRYKKNYIIYVVNTALKNNWYLIQIDIKKKFLYKNFFLKKLVELNIIEYCFINNKIHIKVLLNNRNIEKTQKIKKIKNFNLYKKKQNKKIYQINEVLFGQKNYYLKYFL